MTKHKMTHSPIRRFATAAAFAALALGGVACSDDDDDILNDPDGTVDLDPDAGDGLPGDSDDETSTSIGG